MSRAVAERWDEAEEDHLLFLRDVEHLNFAQIETRLGRSAAACEVRYYTRLYHRNAARHHGRSPCAALTAPPPVRPAPAAVKPQMAPARDASRRSATLDTLRADAELRARIETCGDLTRGWFGDPPPGRSALDKRTGGAAVGAGVSLARGVR